MISPKRNEPPDCVGDRGVIDADIFAYTRFCHGNGMEWTLNVDWMCCVSERRGLRAESSTPSSDSCAAPIGDGKAFCRTPRRLLLDYTLTLTIVWLM